MTSELWSFLFLSAANDGHRLIPQLELIQCFLDRSREWPLDFLLSVPWYQPLDCIPALRLLAGHSKRWRDISISSVISLPGQDILSEEWDAPNLTAMHVHVVETAGLHFLFTSLTCPRLADLEIALPDFGDADEEEKRTHECFVSFLGRSRCPIRRLEFTTLPPRLDVLLKILHILTDSLEILQLPLNSDLAHSALFTNLQLKAGSPPLCCNLWCLSLPIVEEHDYPALTNMLESRWNVPPALEASQLRKVRISFWGEDGWTDRLKALKADGMDITVDDRHFRNHNVAFDL
ncbi:hypothetical protein C8F01DRAFT_703593 [Mycena amicta]|nr:hypothetical protein C8F01DRAFT_703593 [Mycena amicta]